MTREERIEMAAGLFGHGCNCAQALVKVYAERLGADEQTLMRACAGMGAGAAQICGALGGALLLASYANTGKVLPANAIGLSRTISQEFGERTGSLFCSEIKGKETGKVLCSCQDCIRNAAGILEEVAIIKD